MKKKILSLVFAVTLCTAATLTPAYAATADQSSEGSLSTEFTFEMKNDPTYTITIPEAIAMEKDGTPVNITAENVANLDGKKISVTLAGTNYYRNQMVLEGEAATAPRKTSIRYQFVLADDTVLETKGTDTATGTELVSFTEDGTASYIVRPVIVPSQIKKGVTYKGSVTYGIELKDID